MAVPQDDTTTLVVLGLVALRPGSSYDLARPGGAKRGLLVGAVAQPELSNHGRGRKTRHNDR